MTRESFDEIVRLLEKLLDAQNVYSIASATGTYLEESRKRELCVSAKKALMERLQEEVQ